MNPVGITFTVFGALVSLSCAGQQGSLEGAQAEEPSSGGADSHQGAAPQVGAELSQSPSSAGGATQAVPGGGDNPIVGQGGSPQSTSGGAANPNTGLGGASQTTASEEQSAAALEELKVYLTRPPEERVAPASADFTQVALTASDAQAAKELLWEDRASSIREERQSEVTDKSITIGEHTLRYETVSLGEPELKGRSLFISMHGGGSAPAATNDAQWNNQVGLATSYAPKDALWVAPRAPTDVWNMWFQGHIDDLFDRLITNMLVFESIDPDLVYLTGYSAGGDGVYQLAPRMADRWAGAAMSAGHPNDAAPLNLRNLPFALHVGGADAAFMRNTVGAEWGASLEALATGDEGAYLNQVQIHDGLPHWMNLADQVSIPFLQEQRRRAAPNRVIWKQSARLHPRSYWLKATQEPAKGQLIQAQVTAQKIVVEKLEAVTSFALLLSDQLVDLDAEVSVEFEGEILFSGKVPRTILSLLDSLDGREDPGLMFPGLINVSVN